MGSTGVMGLGEIRGSRGLKWTGESLQELVTGKAAAQTPKETGAPSIPFLSQRQPGSGLVCKMSATRISHHLLSNGGQDRNFPQLSSIMLCEETEALKSGDSQSPGDNNPGPFVESSGPHS